MLLLALQKVRLRFSDIIYHRDFEVAKLAASVVWILWSLALLNPYSSTFGSANGFSAMAHYANEVVWGSVGLLLALNEFCSMLSEVRWWRMAASGLLLAWALLIGMMIGLVNPFGTGIAVYPGIGIISGFAFYRSFRERPDAS